MSTEKHGPSSAPEPALPPHTIDQRYRVLGQLGQGGMATVYEVLDVSSDKRMALKRLHALEDARKHGRAVELFEREFHTLSQLAHPCVVEAFDYGVDEHGPYYTMELLDGGELQQLAPLPWRRACALARDIASALSLLHSRRLVYRDLNPRNVRCTNDGTAKLIDFGAMSTMGATSLSKQVIGTPAYCAPEALDFQPLDARTDLYSLGATLYFMLTGRHAYPAKSFRQLRSFWESRPLRPAELVADVPAALDGLAMDLLHLDPGVRPANAAEVIEQLAVIEGRNLDELPQVTQAYLSTPNLVGRDAALNRMRAKISRALLSRGGGLLIEGASGVGRSRLLTACLLEGKLLGALTLHADTFDAQCDYGVMQSLCAQLLESAAELTRDAATAQRVLLAHALPALAPQPTAATSENADHNLVRAEVLSALKDWLLAIAAQRPLLIAIDDLHALDEPSAAALALIAHGSNQQPLLVVATAETSAVATSPSALKLFTDAATTLNIGNLDPPHTDELLRSVFGDVPHVQMVAHKLHAITEGNPRDLMQLAQYLVDRQLATYRAGAWSLPPNIDAADLPANMAQALRVRVEALSTAARELGLYLTLSHDRGLTFDECVTLSGDTTTGSVIAALDELQRAQIVTGLGDVYTIPQRGFSAALRSDLDEATSKRMHAALADVFRKRGDEELRRARHLFLAGERAQGLDVLLMQAETSQALTDEKAEEYFKLTRSMPDDWFDCYQEGLRLCVELERPKRQSYILQARLAGFIDVMNVPGAVGYPPVRALLQQLFEESGLSDYEALDPALDTMARLKSAVETAQARYETRSDRERVFDPLTAIRYLVRATIASAGLAAKNIDYDLWCALPSLAPLVALSPAIAAAHGLMTGVGERTTARLERARETYKALIAATTDPSSSGLGESNHRYLRYGVMFGMGTIEACMGLESSLEWAAAIEAEPTHQVNAQLVRFLFHLWQGDVREADRLKEEIELMRIRNSPRQWLEGAHLPGQLFANAVCDDLTRIKQTLDALEVLAKRQAPWIPVRDYAAAEYDRIRGDLRGAESKLAVLLNGIEAGRHQIWPNAAAAHTRLLFELGDEPLACLLGARYLEQAQRTELGYMANYIKMPLALALTRMHDCNKGTQLADEVIANFHALGTTGLSLVLAYETRARIALLNKDEDEYRHYVALCAKHARSVKSRVLLTKHERLQQAASAAHAVVPDIALTTDLSTTRLGMTTALDADKPSERALKMLELLLRSSGVQRGFLYLIHEAGAELSAQVGELDAPRGLSRYVNAYIASELQDRELNTQSFEEAETEIEIEAAPNTWLSENGDNYRALLLSHHVAAGCAITGVAIVREHATGTFKHPGALVAQLSRIAADSGDAICSTVE